MNQTLTTGQAARMLGVSIRTLRRYVEAGRLTGHRDPINRRWVMTREEVTSFAERFSYVIGDRPCATQLDS